MKYKLIPLDISPIRYEDRSDGNVWRGGAKSFFIVDPSSLEGRTKELDRELRCTVDLLLETGGRTFYAENRFCRVAHTNLSGDPMGAHIGSTPGITYSDFGSANSPGDLSFVKMLYDERVNLDKIGTSTDRLLGLFLGVAIYVNPLLWPFLMMKREIRGVPRMDVVVFRRSLEVLTRLREDLSRLAGDYLQRDYTKTQAGVLELEGEGHREGQGHLLPIPSAFMKDKEYLRYSFHQAYDFVSSPHDSVVRR